jgi:hypothetical protein
MAFDVQEIRDLLNEVRKEALAYFDEVRPFISTEGKSSPWNSLPAEKKDRGYVLRRRVSTVMSRINRAADESPLALAHGSSLDEFAWHGNRAALAMLLRCFVGSTLPVTDSPDEGPFKSIPLDEARQNFLDGYEEAKVLLNKVSGTSQYVPDASMIPTADAAVAGREDKTTNWRLVQGFIERVQTETGRKTTRRNIWRDAAKYASPRQFHYWQSESSKATQTDEDRFRSILSMSSSEFWARIDRASKKS